MLHALENANFIDSRRLSTFVTDCTILNPGPIYLKFSRKVRWCISPPHSLKTRRPIKLITDGGKKKRLTQAFYKLSRLLKMRLRNAHTTFGIRRCHEPIISYKMFRAELEEFEASCEQKEPRTSAVPVDTFESWSIGLYWQV